MSWYIYVLKLEQNKYYVGRTQDVFERTKEHFRGEGSVWTKLYKPVALVKSYESYSRFDEDNQTKKYMEIYSVDNVRGGSYTRRKLSEEEKFFLNRELASLGNKCFNCGKLGHYSKKCYTGKRKVNQFKLKPSDISESYPTLEKEANRNLEAPQEETKIIAPKRQMHSGESDEDDELFQRIRKKKTLIDLCCQQVQGVE